MNYLQRKKLAFMSIANKIKGFIREVSDTPPLTLEDCVDSDSLIDYKIYGNSFQSSFSTSITANVVGIQADTNYAYFNKADIPNVYVGMSVSFIINSTTYNLKVMDIDDTYVYIENIEV